GELRFAVAKLRRDEVRRRSSPKIREGELRFAVGGCLRRDEVRRRSSPKIREGELRFAVVDLRAYYIS
ncbi:MAG: hypothetical protein WC921_03285, partial [Candidatus Paceibacterota bacterium]